MPPGFGLRQPAAALEWQPAALRAEHSATRSEKCMLRRMREARGGCGLRKAAAGCRSPKAGAARAAFLLFDLGSLFITRQDWKPHQFAPLSFGVPFGKNSFRSQPVALIDIERIA